LQEPTQNGTGTGRTRLAGESHRAEPPPSLLSPPRTSQRPAKVPGGLRMTRSPS